MASRDDDVVAVWDVPLSDHNHRIEFEHGTVSGKRVIRVDGIEVKRENWMFKLVGSEYFTVGSKKCVIHIDAVSGFAYEYKLEIDGKTYQKFTENIKKVVKTWKPTLRGRTYRICFEKDSVEVIVNGQKVETTGMFEDDGVETFFTIPDAPDHSACIKAVSSGKKSQGIIHTLFIDEQEIPEAPPEA